MNKYTLSIVASGLLVFVAGCQVVAGERTVHQYSSDASITTSVKAAFLNYKPIPSPQIHVETDKGTVLLSGFVKTHRQKLKYGQLASQVQGVKVVQNNLVIHR